MGVKNEELFWTRVEVGHPLGCWEWTGTLNEEGYGNYGRGNPKAHRLVYEILVGPVPEGMTLDHLCRNKACVNPDHLEPVTRRENALRGYGPTARNARKTHCVWGHPFTPDNTYPNQQGRHCVACARRRAREWKAAR